MLGYTPQFQYEVEESPERKIQGIVEGQFILDGETIFLQLKRRGDRFRLQDVGFAASAFNNQDGILRYPRPFIYDADGNMTQQGDLVLVAFERGDIFNPIVLSSVIPINKDDFFHEFTRNDYQKKKARFETAEAVIECQDDGKGELQLDITGQQNGTGNITLNLTGFGNENGNITINVNGNVNINAEQEITIDATENVNINGAEDVIVNASDQVTVGGKTKVVIDTPAIELGKSATEALIKGNQWLNLYTTHVHADPTSGFTGVPTNAASAAGCLSARNKTL